MTRTVLQDAFDHHVWATLRLIDVCLALTPEQLATTVPGTYGSILDTMRHLVGADRSYLALLSGDRMERIDEDASGLAELRTVMAEDGPLWTEVVQGDGDAERIVVRHRDDGSESAAPLGIRLVQVVQHGTDHRSQICTALTTLGIEPPEIDVWAYAWAQGWLIETPPTDAA
ncbi:MAG: damage-inducible protein DinB [Chloroflexota bacterium]|nr:MAG: damage-inducible protein DinB [Chloroflexota bacterium]